MQGKAEKNGEQQDLQNLAFGERVDRRGRNDVEQEFGGRVHLAWAGVRRQGVGIEGGRIDIHTGARLQGIDDDQTDDEGHRAHHFEIDECKTAGLADFLDVFDAGNARHHSAKDNWCNQHLDELDEPITQRLHFRAKRRIAATHQHPECDGHDDLEVQRRQQSFHAATLSDLRAWAVFTRRHLGCYYAYD